tara:strand:+ start:6891 stop:7130 length:240 start_codon:yes stop_codon:yes gene_type:complete
MSRWFPREGDLVAVPAMKVRGPGVRANCSYGLVIRESPHSEFKGAWWDIMFDGILQSIHIQVINPICDKEGEWIQPAMK